jgi:hypothetical protein
VIGSLFYKDLSYKQSLEILLTDFVDHRLDPNSLFGNYVILFFLKNSNLIHFCIDPSFIKNVYFNSNEKIISTDFLSITESLLDKFTLNHLALIENITTGYLISPDTYANEIQKLDKKNISSLRKIFPDIKMYQLKPDLDHQMRNCNQAIDHANQKLADYFKSVKNLTNEFGAHIGLTGGFDSRLLLMHARKHLTKLITNSFWRPNSIEYLNAKELAKIADLDFITFENTPFIKFMEEESIEKSYLFFDGQIRSQNNWNEEFNLSDYSFRIAANHFVGFHGCGGEQYRNADRMMRKITLRTYIKYEWMFRQCQDVFIDKNLQHVVFKNIENKIKRLIDIPNNKVGLPELKKIQNEIWNSANRATRVNVVNQQLFYFAPFTEYQLSQAAYWYIPCLGNAFSFQIEMMKRIDQELLNVNTNYGFNLLRGKPIKFKLVPYLFNYIPRQLFYYVYFLLKDVQKNKFNINEFQSNSHPALLKYAREININKLGQNVHLGKNLKSFDYLLKNVQFKF